ncbi:unnamed protein product [Ceutorhynchus assimilis]|uniref:Peptidase S1 domain-containing protein n=1 Tax=Ceutorhynchus assimilis TaxID=467358 RepID=A0A9N9QS79_9CUCU|nr:unnamed protein product [Ceutorhynchus assimilis]
MPPGAMAPSALPSLRRCQDDLPDLLITCHKKVAKRGFYTKIVTSFVQRKFKMRIEKRPPENVNFLVEVVRKDTKERVAVGTLLSPTRVLTSAKPLVLSPSRYEANLEVPQRRRKRFLISIIAAVIASSVGAAVVASVRSGGKINSNLLNNGDIAILTIKVPHHHVSRSALTFVKLLVPSDIKSRFSFWHYLFVDLPKLFRFRTGRFKIADTPCKKATVLGWKQSATVDIIGAKKCADQFNIQLNDRQFCSLNEENLFCDANQQGGPVMCGDFQVGILIPGRYCNETGNGLPGEPLQFAPIEYYIDSIARAMKPREDEKPLSNDNSTVPTPTTDSEGICLKPYTNIFALLLIAILLYILI